MADKTEEVWANSTVKTAPAPKGEPGFEAAIPATREAMSWIRALANDWEDERSHSELGK